MDYSIQEWLTLHLVSDLGAKGFKRLLDTFGCPANVFKASRKDLQQVGGIRTKAIEQLVTTPPYKQAEEEIYKAKQSGVSILSWADQDYPALLKNIYNPPMVLYVKGDKTKLKQNGIAVVGSRAATSYGLKVARHMSGQLAANGIAVISGLALGVDTAAHNGSLDESGGTIAVLGCGLDVIYPRQNVNLAQRIGQKGAVVSEYPFGTKPDAFRFPARNRIISGLSYGVLVVEAAARSGSLITARLALEEGREVFAIPGRVDSSKSSGTHRLLQEGAKLVNRVDDILEELPFRRPVFSKTSENEQERLTGRVLQGDETKIMSVLDGYPKHIDSIIDQAGISTKKVNELLLVLELEGLVESLSGQQYRAVL